LHGIALTLSPVDPVRNNRLFVSLSLLKSIKISNPGSIVLWCNRTGIPITFTVPVYVRDFPKLLRECVHTTGSNIDMWPISEPNRMIRPSEYA
jgi:hypothetical protein